MRLKAMYASTDATTSTDSTTEFLLVKKLMRHTVISKD